MTRPRPTAAVLLILVWLPLAAAGAEDAGWIDLMPGGHELDAWQQQGKWITAGDAVLDLANPRALAAGPGNGVLISSLKGGGGNLTSRQQFTDLEAHVEFLVPKGSNSGVKFMKRYEIQIFDSFGRKKITASDSGGVYPRAEQRPRYHTIDEGFPARVNAARPAGHWQTLDVVFHAPRFDAAGAKTQDARFVKVVLNGQVIHEDVDLTWPTGAAWRLDKEVARGPLYLQGDHGPVAFRNVRVKVVDPK